jgi:flagellar capping protein FliD
MSGFQKQADAVISQAESKAKDIQLYAEKESEKLLAKLDVMQQKLEDKEQKIDAKYEMLDAEKAKLEAK